MQAEKLFTWAVLQNDDRIVLQFAGELSRNTLLPFWNEWQDQWKKGQQRSSFLTPQQIAKQNLHIDLAQLQNIDSAGFALLCDFIACCRKNQQAEKQLRLENAPTQLFTLADLYNLDDWLKKFLQ